MTAVQRRLDAAAASAAKRLDVAWRAYGMAVWAHLRRHDNQQAPDGPAVVDARDTLCTALDLDGKTWADRHVLPRARRR